MLRTAPATDCRNLFRLSEILPEDLKRPWLIAMAPSTFKNIYCLYTSDCSLIAASMTSESIVVLLFCAPAIIAAVMTLSMIRGLPLQ